MLFTFREAGKGRRNLRGSVQGPGDRVREFGGMRGGQRNNRSLQITAQFLIGGQSYCRMRIDNDAGFLPNRSNGGQGLIFFGFRS